MLIFYTDFILLLWINIEKLAMQCIKGRVQMMDRKGRMEGMVKLLWMEELLERGNRVEDVSHL